MNGASMRMTIQPARICQMPATMHSGSVVNGKKAIKPKMMAPENKKKLKIVGLTFQDTTVVTICKLNIRNHVLVGLFIPHLMLPSPPIFI